MSTPQVLTQPDTQLQLVVPDPLAVRQELGLVDPKSLVPQTRQEDEQLILQAKSYVDSLINFTPEDFQARENSKLAAERAGWSLSQQGAKTGSMLRESIRTLSKHGQDGEVVANALLSLKETVEDLDPHKWDFAPGWISSAQKKLKRYFVQYEAADSVIADIFESLKKGKGQLERDNQILLGDQIKARQLTFKLGRLAKLLISIDHDLASRLGTEILEEDEKYKFIEEELLFTIRQRTMDVQQELAVRQQEVLSLELIMRNNRELIRGVNRAERVTMSALETAVKVSIALTHQAIVLKKLEAITVTTSNLIEENAQLLRTQGVAIQKQASDTTIEMEKLKSSFANIHGAMEDLSRYRSEALPKMAQTVLELDQLTTEAEKRISRMERGNRMRPNIIIDVDAEVVR